VHAWPIPSLVCPWQILNPPYAPTAQVNEVQFAGKQKDTVLIVTKYSGSVWRSADTGKTWKSMKGALRGDDDGEFSGAFSVVRSLAPSQPSFPPIRVPVHENSPGPLP
jgi:hypothetical protein